MSVSLSPCLASVLAATAAPRAASSLLVCAAADAASQRLQKAMNPPCFVCVVVVLQ
jgi:hypothetical protein